MRLRGIVYAAVSLVLGAIGLIVVATGGGGRDRLLLTTVFGVCLVGGAIGLPMQVAARRRGDD